MLCCTDTLQLQQLADKQKLMPVTSCLNSHKAILHVALLLPIDLVECGNVSIAAICALLHIVWQPPGSRNLPHDRIQGWGQAAGRITNQSCPFHYAGLMIW